MMNSIFNIKVIALVWLCTLILTACSAISPTEKQASFEPTIELDSVPSAKAKPSDWQQSYGAAQEPKPNALPDSDVAPVIDVWQRLRTGFAMTPALPLNKPTQAQLKRFLKNPKYINTVVERARPYMYYIVSELDKRNMPMEIALLPIVESGFKPYVYSSSGAAGLWQFMPATGNVFGLHQTSWYDGRRDIVASTDAALDYLQKLYGYFDDWQLAIAAYNAGEGTVGRAIKKNKKAGKATDFWSLKLPRETTAYIPKLMAISHLIFQPEQYNITVRPLDNKPVFAVVDIGSQIDLSLAAKLANMSNDALYLFNPGFNYWATRPDGPHQLVLPVEKVAGFKRKLAALPIKERMQWQRHRIEPGESLGLIAEHYKTTTAILKKANKLSSTKIRSGRHLLIPISTTKTSDLIGHQAAAKKKSLRNKPSNSKKIIHVVQQGDTWWDLAIAYNVDVKNLTGWNGKAPQDTLGLGQNITVWLPNSVSASKHLKAIDYQIKRGDSLWKIAQEFDVSVADVREWNGLSTRALLKPGQTLKLFIAKSI